MLQQLYVFNKTSLVELDMHIEKIANVIIKYVTCAAAE